MRDATRRWVPLDSIVLCLFFNLLILPAPDAAASESPEWTVLPSGTSNTPDVGWDVAVHPNGDVSLVGSSAGQLVVIRTDARGERLWARVEATLGLTTRVHAVASGEGVFVVSNLDDEDDYLTRVYFLSGEGEVEWSEWADRASGATSDNLGGCYVAGTTEIGYSTDCHFDCPGVIRRFDASGLRWTAFSAEPPTYSGNLFPIAADRAGSSYGAFVDASGQRSASSIAKFSPDGERLWTRLMAADGTPGELEAVAMTTTPDDLIVAAISEHGDRMLSISADGAERWWQPLPSDFETQIAAGDGRIYVAGVRPTHGGKRDVWVFAYDTEGTLLWTTTHDTGPQDDTVRDVAVSGRRSIVVLAENSDGPILMKLHPSGRIRWTDQIAGDDATWANLTLDPRGRPYVAGSAAGPGVTDLAVWRWQAPRESRLLHRFDREIEPRWSYPSALIASRGDVLIAHESTFLRDHPTPLETADLVSYSHLGEQNARVQIRVAPRRHMFIEPAWTCAGAHGPALTVARKLDRHVEVRRYETTAELTWRTLIRMDGYQGRQPIVATNDPGDVLINQPRYGNRLVMLDANGRELWRREIEYPMHARLVLANDRSFYTLTGDDGVTVHRFDAHGELLWSTPIEAAERLVTVRVAIGASGALYLAQLVGSDPESLLRARVDPDGTVAWANLDSPAPLSPVRMLAIRDGGVVVSGFGRSADGVRTTRYAADGEAIWTALLPETTSRLDSDDDHEGNVFVVATHDGEAREARTVSYDPNGNQRWMRSFAMAKFTSPHALVVDEAGAVFVSGSLQQESTTAVTQTFVLKYSNDGRQVLAGAASTSLGAPTGTALLRVGPALPNPARGPVTIPFVLSSGGHASLRLSDATGRVVSRLEAGGLAAGAHSFTWDGRTVNGDQAAQGVYFYRLEAGGTTHSGKLLIVR